MTAIMSSGKYWIGNLNYVLSAAEYEEFAKKVNDTGETAGVFTLNSGTKFMFLLIKPNRFEYIDDMPQNMYICSWAEAIGAIKISDISEPNYDFLELGAELTFDSAFQVIEKDNVLYFGEYSIECMPKV